MLATRRALISRQCATAGYSQRPFGRRRRKGTRARSYACGAPAARGSARGGCAYEGRTRGEDRGHEPREGKGEGRHGPADSVRCTARGWVGVVATGAPASRAGAVYPTQGSRPRHTSQHQWELRSCHHPAARGNRTERSFLAVVGSGCQ
eukprot:5995143-Pleurochrysis_carterae.AAC.1